MTAGLATLETPGAAQDSCRILIVDDQEWSREILAGHLRSAGFDNLCFARDGVEALRQVALTAPDLIVLDIVMPEMDGYEVCRRLRADGETADLPILVQTVLEEPAQRTKAFQTGATDLVIKPVNRQELLARVAVHLQNRILVRDLRAYRRRVVSELAIAREMQLSLLPPCETLQAIEQTCGISLAAAFQPSTELGGDFWGVTRLPDCKLALFTCDVSGHGAGAALNTFRIHALLQTLREPANPGASLQELNERLAGVLPVGIFATMFYGVLEADNIVYAAAACPAPLVRTGGLIEAGDGAGFPLGILRGARYENRTLPFPAGAKLILHSDALVEAQGAGDSTLDESGILRIVEGLPERASAQDCVDALQAAYSAHLAGQLSPDDLTIVCLTR